MILDIWNSFRRLPTWVQFWVAGILVPVNMAALLFVDQPNGWLIAGLAIGGMMPNLVIMLRERGLSKAMALPHLVIWTPLVLLLIQMPPTTPYLWLLLAVDALSLAFDFPDAWKWWRGDRAVA